jgi:hypothetical protein
VSVKVTRENLPEGTVLRFYDDGSERIVRWKGDTCVVFDDSGKQRNSRPEGDRFYNDVYTVVSRPDTDRVLYYDKTMRPGDWLASLTNSERKQAAMFRGLLAYFPDALAMVSRHSVRSNDKHNPGQPVHWAREKSTDHDDCIIRHSAAIAADPMAQDDGQYEVVCRAWRALAALQVWIEEQHAKGVKL